MNASRAEYERRMHRVLAHIDAHLADPLDLASLAAVANFSPFHFHRLFTAWMGETLADYVRRRRVEVAAMKLASQPRLGVLAAALAAGFGSGEAFARAFRARFGASPSAWRAAQRAKRKNGQAVRKIDQAPSPRPGDDDAMDTPLDIELIDLPPVRYAYLRYTGPYGDALHRFWGERVDPWLGLHRRHGRETYGLSHDDPNVTRPEDCRYDAAVALADGETPGRDELTGLLPGGRYAVLHFNGPVQTIGAAWDRLLRDWLPGTGLQLDGRPCFERYPATGVFDAATGFMRCDVCVPVAPL